MLNTTLWVPGVELLVAGLDHAKFGFYQSQSFFVDCCHGDIDFTENYILTNFNSQSISSEKFVAVDKDKIASKMIEKHRYGLPKTVSKHLKG